MALVILVSNPATTGYQVAGFEPAGHPSTLVEFRVDADVAFVVGEWKGDVVGVKPACVVSSPLLSIPNWLRTPLAGGWRQLSSRQPRDPLPADPLQGMIPTVLEGGAGTVAVCPGLATFSYAFRWFADRARNSHDNLGLHAVVRRLRDPCWCCCRLMVPGNHFAEGVVATLSDDFPSHPRRAIGGFAQA